MARVKFGDGGVAEILCSARGTSATILSATRLKKQQESEAELSDGGGRKAPGFLVSQDPISSALGAAELESSSLPTRTRRRRKFNHVKNSRSQGRMSAMSKQTVAIESSSFTTASGPTAGLVAPAAGPGCRRMS